MTMNKDWWRGAVIYQIYPRSFYDSNSDGIGDIPGITEKLDYIASLGVDAIWLSPFFKSPMKDFGYDVADYRAVDPMFGTLRDFDDMVNKAHTFGLKVMIDLVLSHSSDQHVWFQESRRNRNNPKADWYVWADAGTDGGPPNNWLSVFGGSAWEWDKSRQQYYFHNFLASQPDLNFHHPEVQQQMLNETEFWLERGVDGMRLDVVNYYFHHKELPDNPMKTSDQMNAFMGMKTNPYNEHQHLFDKSQPENLEFLKKLRSLTERYPGTTTLGEIGDDRAAELMGQYTSGGDKLHMAYCFRLLRDDKGAEFIRESVSEHEQKIGDGWPCWSLSNHDVERVATRWGRSGTSDEICLLQALVLSLRGSACIYNGDELGLTQAEIARKDVQDPFGIAFWPDFKGRDGCRTPMVWQADDTNAGFSTAKSWLPVFEDHLPLSVDRQHNNYHSILNRFRRFLKWRKQQPALLQGSIEFTGTDKDCLMFMRSGNEQRLLCVFNLTEKSKQLKLPEECVAGQILSAEVFSSDIANGRLELPPFQAAYISC